MSEKKKERIAGLAWNKIQATKKRIEKLQDGFRDWQLEQFNPGESLERFFHDQVNFTNGTVVKYGGIPNERPICRIDKALQRTAMTKQLEIDKLIRELSDIFDRVAQKLSIVKGYTVYASQIDVKTGTLDALAKDTRRIEINIDEEDSETVKRVADGPDKQSEIAELFDDAEDGDEA